MESILFFGGWRKLGNGQRILHFSLFCRLAVFNFWKGILHIPGNLSETNTLQVSLAAMNVESSCAGTVPFYSMGFLFWPPLDKMAIHSAVKKWKCQMAILRYLFINRVGRSIDPVWKWKKKGSSLTWLQLVIWFVLRWWVVLSLNWIKILTFNWPTK